MVAPHCLSTHLREETVNVVLDIETIPCDDDARKELPPPSPPRTLKDESKIKRWREEKLAEAEEEQYLRTALDANFGRIFCIGMLFFDEKKEFCSGVSIFGKKEDAILSAFWDQFKEYKSPRIVTHNGLQFDLPFIWKRSVILRVQPSMKFNLIRYRTDYVYDTMDVWSNWDMRNAIKLDKLAKVLGLPGKTGTGADVYDLWKAGKHKEIAEYCFQDVYVTYCCYCRMNFIAPVDKSKISVEYLDVAHPKG